MHDADRTAPRVALRAVAPRRQQPAGEWSVDDAWLEHRAAHGSRRLPLDLVLDALDALARAGALHPDGGVALERVRGVRAHHPRHGRWAIELRSTRWELAWYPRGACAQRIGLAGAAEHVGVRRWRRDEAA